MGRLGNDQQEARRCVLAWTAGRAAVAGWIGGLTQLARMKAVGTCCGGGKVGRGGHCSVGASVSLGFQQLPDLNCLLDRVLESVGEGVAHHYQVEK